MDKLLVISIGPVQEFISAARRSRDLWAGSMILSAMSRRAALALRDGRAGLIFPHPNTDLDGAIDKGDPVANILVAVCEGEVAGRIKELAAKAERAVRDVWRELGDKIERESFAGYLNKDRFKRQLQTGIEFYWAQVDLKPGDYRACRRELMHLLTSRKALRDFQQFAGEATIPKSSLDGARETVFLREIGDDAHANVRLKLRMHPGEQLDAVGLVKRAGVGTQQFPSIPRIAADPWLRGLQHADPNRLAELRDKCEHLMKTDEVEWMSAINPGKFPQMARVFPFEASVAFQSRLTSLRDEGADKQQIAELRTLVKKLEAANGEPNPYAAVLVADGDFMGKAISKIDSYPKHQDFSRELAAFAAAAEKTVKRHYGSPVFAGGDDVLAFVPVDTAIECADALRDDFEKAMGRWKVTLSVGIGVGHNLEAMEDLLSYARGAEQAAKKEKPERNALAIHFYPRSGLPVKVRRQWDTDIVKQLQTMIGLYLDNEFPDGAAYEIHEMARHYKGWQNKNPNLQPAMIADAKRVLGRKATSGAVLASIHQLLEKRLGKDSTGADMEMFAEQMLVARRFTGAYRQSRRRPGDSL
ncbi:MAG: type III-B CRISPR-associated protein Cas10/Cmr2 [Bryobacterales bacterium]|nr:type III-B CRISPR-associated protein Cas10/Cmr2 [Bryobacterales bacterium]